MDNAVYALAIYNGDLYAGGAFTNAGSGAASHIAKWDGGSWAPVGAGVNSNVYAREVIGGWLYVGGGFTTTGGSSAAQIAKWNGSSWSAVGSGTNADVNALKTIGSDLYVGGNFTTSGGSYTPFIAKWNGSSWSDAGSIGGSQFDLSVEAISSYNGNVYVGGRFSTYAADTTANHIAKSAFSVGVPKSNLEKSSALVYPNPFSNKIALKNANGLERYELINQIGQTVWAGKQIEQQDFSVITEGIYFLKVSTPNSVSVSKLIKQ